MCQTSCILYCSRTYKYTTQEKEVEELVAELLGNLVCLQFVSPSSQVSSWLGDVLLSLKPHVAALSNEHIDTYCSNCFSPGTSLKRCTSCRFVHYCDPKCQSTDWPIHKHECLALQGSASAAQGVPGSSSSGSIAAPSDAIRCLGRILWRKQKLGQESVWVCQSSRTSCTTSHNLPGSGDECYAVP